MKKIVYALVVAMLLPLFSANAEKLCTLSQINNTSLKNIKVTKEMLLTPPLDFKSNKHFNTLQANEYYTNTVSNTPLGTWIGYGQLSTPMAYDPESNILIYSTYTTGPKPTIEDPQGIYCTINLFWTADNGENWDRDTLGSFANEILVCPSIGVTSNPSATTPQELNIVNFSRYAAKDLASGGWPWAGAYYHWNNSAGYDFWPTTGPEEGENYNFYNWPTSDLSVYKTGGITAATAVCILGQKPNTSAKYGIYGQASLDIDNFNNKFSLPNEWAPDNFWIYDKDFYSSYNGKIVSDADNFGNVYACVFNFCNNNDLDSTRTPAVSKSTDGGKTWGTFNLCPSKLITDYMTANNFYRYWPDGFQNPGSLIQWSLSSFNKNGFVVTGKDEYSFISAMYCLYSVNDSFRAKVRMVELSRANNVWSLKPIADLPFFSSTVAVYEVTNANGDRMYDTLSLSYDDFEINAAKTADGNDVVCSWIANTKNYVFNPPIQFEQKLIDTVPTNDIFGAVRAKNSAEWTAVQFTNDDHYNKLTRLPKTVQNRNNVALIAHESRYLTTNTVWNAYPEQLRNMNFLTFQSFYLMNLDFSNPEKYMGPGAVNNKEVINFTLNTPVPNPATSSTELTFNMKEGAYTTIAVYNSLGAKVAELQNGFIGEGLHGMTINTESYAAGVYYITLTAGSNSATQILNVVR